MTHDTTTLLCFSGLDPVGGAGIQADIESIAAQGGHAMAIITANTQQDSEHVYAIQPINADFILQQAERVLADVPVSGIKIGLLGSVEVAEAVLQILQSRPDIPVVFDPVLASGMGDPLSSEPLLKLIREKLLPYCTILTPNTLEAQRLAADSESAISAASQLSGITDHVLLTGSHAATEAIEHRLFQRGKQIHTYQNPRLPAEYHGSGCTLAASLAFFIARGEAIETACQRALDYTFQSLQNARALGRGQLIPQRIHEKTR